MPAVAIGAAGHDAFRAAVGVAKLVPERDGFGQRFGVRLGEDHGREVGRRDPLVNTVRASEGQVGGNGALSLAWLHPSAPFIGLAR